MFKIRKIFTTGNTNLLLIILVAALLRICFLSTIPNGFHQDEATIGYDAYSMLKTRRNQYGEFLPLFSKAFGDYNESLSRFITVPFIGIFGLNEFATRLPIAIIGSLTVFVLYFLAKELFNTRIALLSALFLAISPWHIQFSRIAYTAILVPFFFCLGLLCFLKSLKKPLYLVLSSIAFVFSIYTYSPARVFIPIFMLCLVILYGKHLWNIRKETIIACTIFIPFFILLFSFWISPEGMTRVRTVGGLINNPVQIISNYLSYFSPKFLFLSGDSFPRHSPPGVGELHFLEILTVPIGLVLLTQENNKKRYILFLWLLLYPIPAALTAPEHALRVIVGTPLFAILSGYGLAKIGDMRLLPKKTLSRLVILGIAMSVVWFCSCYFLIYPKYSKNNTWRYGIKEAIHYAENSSYPCILFSNRFHHTNIFILFYTQYEPRLYQMSPIDPSVSFQNQGSYNLGKYRISPISPELVFDDRCLLIIHPDEIEMIIAGGYDWYKIHTIVNPRGKKELLLLEIKGQQRRNQDKV